MKKLIVVVLILGTFLFSIGCVSSHRERGIFYGGALGAGAGQLIGKTTKGTLRGGLIGATLGGIFGDMIDQVSTPRNSNQISQPPATTYQQPQVPVSTPYPWCTNTSPKRTH